MKRNDHGKDGALSLRPFKEPAVLRWVTHEIVAGLNDV